MIYLMFAMGLAPIILVYFLLAFFIGRTAKKRDKNPWLWGAVSFALMIAISWNKLPSWAAKIYYKGAVAMHDAQPKGQLISLAGAKNINISSSVDGVHFDVPLTYHLRSFNRQDRGWYNIAKGQMDGTERPAVDFINIWALLPNLEPMNEENVAEFEVLGHGKIVAASLTHIRSWNYYFENFFKRAEKRPESSQVPGMLHYYDSLADMYFSHDYATPDLTVIRCRDQSVHHDASPSCQVETSYRPAPELIASEHIEGAIFRLEYHFASQYLPQWRDIDEKLKLHFDQFIRNTHTSLR